MVHFIVDSTFGLKKSYAAAHDVSLVSLTLTIGSKEYIEGYREEWQQFYYDYAGGKTAARTSQPSPALFISAIRTAIEKDPSAEIIILTIGDRLSGTVGSANIAAMQFPETHLSVINTESASIAAFIMLDELIKARDGGASFVELCRLAEDLKGRLVMRFIPFTLTELARGGRVGKLISHIGTALNIKPVFDFVKNNITVTYKTIGMRLAVAAAIKLPEFERVALCYIHDDKNVAMLKDRMFGKYGMSHIDVAPVSPVLGAHIGVGTVGIGLLKK